jgi:hypothetical protein
MLPGQIEKALRIFLSTTSKINEALILSRKNFFFYAIFFKKKKWFLFEVTKNPLVMAGCMKKFLEKYQKIRNAENTWHRACGLFERESDFVP